MLLRITRLVGLLLIVLVGAGAIYQVVASGGDSDRNPNDCPGQRNVTARLSFPMEEDLRISGPVG